MSRNQPRNIEAPRKAHEWLVEDTDLFANVVDQAGQYDAKIDPEANCSLAAHILNAVTVGVNTFVYQAIGPEDHVEDYEEEIRVLAAALTLHDTNKYVRAAYGFDAEGNTSEAFDRYFEEGDDFGVEEFLGGDYRDDLHYIVQNTEIREDSTETRGMDTEFRGLERYARIGDQVASIVLRDGIQGAHDKLCQKMDDSEVHLVTFTQLEQPILNDLVLGSVKEAIAGEVDGSVKGVVIGSTSNEILYLGSSLERELLRNLTERQLPNHINTFNFSCKLTWNSFDYDILEELALPVDLKKNIIAEQASNLLLDGAGGLEPFETIPENFQAYLPVLIKAIYEDGCSEYPIESLTEAYEDVYNSIEGGKSTKGQKIKIQFLHYLCQNYQRYSNDLQLLKEDIKPELEADLTADRDPIGTAISRFFQDSGTQSLGSKGHMCFLCGSHASNHYEKGHETIYQSQGFSRRLPPHSGPKSICDVCNLEYNLLFDICARKNINLNRSSPGSRNLGLLISYYYFDSFMGDMRLRRDRVGMPAGDNLDLSDRDLVTSLIQPQYYIQPFKFGDHPHMGEQNQRMMIVRNLMEKARESGMKVAVGRPFTRFESADRVFTDKEATRPQELLGLDEVERFGPLPDFVEDDRTDSHLRRAISLFRIMSMVGQEAGMSNPYIQLDRDTFHSLAHFAVVNHEYATQLDELQTYFESYHEDALMDMKTVAERGVDLFGKQYDSKYKKTKIFREAIDAFLSGMNQRMEDERLIDYVEGQVYAAAEREDYAGYVEPGEAEAFVDSIRMYLVENDLYELKKLSDWEDALVNSYYYAYDQVLQN